MLGGHNSTEEEDLEKERERLLRRNTIEADLANAERADTINHYNSYDDGVDLSHRPDLWRPLEPGLTEQERRAVARKRVQRIFQLPLTFKKPHHEDINMPNINITPTPSSSGAEEIKRFQINRPANHFLIADYNKTKIQVKCQKDFEGAERPDWSVVRWIHVDKIEESNLPILKANLPAPILIKDITRPSYKFRVEEHERYVLIILHLIANPEDAASNSRRRSVVGDISKSSKSSKSSKFSSDGKRQRSSDEITTVKLIVYLFFEANTLVTVTETPNTLLANCILTRLSREPSRIRNSDCSYLLYYIIKFTLAPLQLIINYHSEYLEMMEDKITYQRMEVASYQNIFHEIHEIRRELQHLRTRLVNISEAIDDVREIADREIESRAPIVAAASAFESQLYKSDAQKGKFVAPSPNVERTGIFPHRLKLASIVRLQFKHLSSNVNQMAVQTTTLQEVCSWLADLVFQTLSQKMNQTMKTLTLISMIFIPLTFIVGVYGTNFDYLPELRWKYGYIFLWGLCAGVVIVELIMFRRLRWI